MAAFAPMKKILTRTTSIFLYNPSQNLLKSQFHTRTRNFPHKFMFAKPHQKCLFQRPFSSQVLYQTDVTVEYRDGLPVISLPLPSRKDICEFSLKPITQNVGDFVQFIKEEDGGIDTVGLFTKDGNRIAKSTSIDVLLRSEFSININEQKYQVTPPVVAPMSSEDAQTLNDVKILISQLYSTMHVESYQLERETELRKRLETLHEQIAPLQQKRDTIFSKADDNTNRLAWLGLGLMSLQFGVLARLTWWEYSWDIMEPVTYFVTYGTSMGMFAYFVLTKQEYLFPDAKDRQFLLKFHKLADKEKLDVEKYNKLTEAISEAEHDLRRLRDPLQLHLPIKEMEKMAKRS